MKATIAQDDEELMPWILGIANAKPTPAGGFLRLLAATALHADHLNYPLLRPVLLEIRQKYPQYREDGDKEGGKNNASIPW